MKRAGVKASSISCGCVHTAVSTVVGEVVAGSGVNEVRGRTLRACRSALARHTHAKRVLTRPAPALLHVRPQVRTTVGGHVYVAGPAAALGRFTPHFKLVQELYSKNVKQVSCGYSSTGCVTVEGELFTWGNNKASHCHVMPLC